MKTLAALKKLAKRLCSKATDDALKFLTIDQVICYIAENFDGGVPASAANTAPNTNDTNKSV